MRTLKIYNNPIKKVFGSKKNLLVFWFFLIVVAKVIRYTVLKLTLVDAGIGHTMISVINKNDAVFTWFDIGGEMNATGNATWFFEKTNFIGLSSYSSFEILITIIWNLLIILLLKRCIDNYDDLQSLFLVVSILALNIFDLNLAKEPVQILFFIIIFYILSSKNLKTSSKWIATIFCLLFSIVTFRIYYILMLFWAGASVLVFDFYLKKKFNIRRLIVILVGIIIMYIMLMLIVQKISTTTFLELIRVRTRQSTATTDIRAVFDSSNIILFSLNYLLVVFRIMFPIELLRFGMKFFVFFFVQITITLVYLKALFNINKLRQNEKIALYLFTGFILMSAFFEPDFGSWIRHEIAAFPLLLILSGLLK